LLMRYQRTISLSCLVKDVIDPKDDGITMADYIKLIVLVGIAAPRKPASLIIIVIFLRTSRVILDIEEVRVVAEIF